MGERACIGMNLIKRVFASTTEPPSSLSRSDIEREYSDIFTGIGKYASKYNITLKPNSRGVAQPFRKIPYSLQPKLKAYLDQLEASGIIANVDRPTEWVSNLVIVEKKNRNLRICLDPKPLSTAIMRERLVIPTPHDIQAHLSGKK